MHVVEMCVCLCVSPHDNLKTIADICLLLGSYVYLRKINLSQLHRSRSRSRSFLEGSRSFGKVMNYFVPGISIHQRSWEAKEDVVRMCEK